MLNDDRSIQEICRSIEILKDGDERVNKYLDAKEIKQRNAEIQHLERELEGIQDIMESIGELVWGQEELVKEVEVRTDTAAMDVATGTEELEKAAELQGRTRFKMYVLAGGALLGSLFGGGIGLLAGVPYIGAGIGFGGGSFLGASSGLLKN